MISPLRRALAPRSVQHVVSRRGRSFQPALDELDSRLLLAANITGLWEGTLTQPNGGIQTTYDFVMNLVQNQNDNSVQGVSRIELTNPASFGVMTLTGTMSGNTFTFQEQTIAYQNLTSGYAWLIKSGSLEESTDATSMAGTWSAPDRAATDPSR